MKTSLLSFLIFVLFSSYAYSESAKTHYKLDESLYSFFSFLNENSIVNEKRDIDNIPIIIVKDFAEISWEERENEVYPIVFGTLPDEIYTIPSDIFSKTYRFPSYDPRWLYTGVIELKPTSSRSSWLYITSGLSNEWVDTKDEVSGAGVEFVIETFERSSWAIQILHKIMAYNLILFTGEKGLSSSLQYNLLIPINYPFTDNKKAQVKHLITTKPDHYPDSFSLISGSVKFLHLVGVTHKEVEYAKQKSMKMIIDHLKKKQIYPFTDPYRDSSICSMFDEVFFKCIL